jgi:hypothetical protein
MPQHPDTTYAANFVRLLPLAAAVLLAAFVSHAHAEVTQLPVTRCLAGKLRGIGKSVAARTACASKEASKGTSDPACRQRASDAFTGGANPLKGMFEKLEAKYPMTDAAPCPTYDDTAAFEIAIGDYAASVAADAGSAVGHCDAAKIKCLGKYVAAVTLCDAKAAKGSGQIDPSCTETAAGKLANGARGCLDRAAFAGDCTHAGSQSIGLRGAADEFVHDALCAFDPSNAGCAVDPPRWIDNGDGTVIDLETGLQWEQKTGSTAAPVDCSSNPCPDPHAASNTYQWCRDDDHDTSCDDIFVGGVPVWPPNGGAFTDFVPALNAGSGFAGHTDWRVPTIDELQTILPEPFICGTNPCIDPVFGPTASARYWSASDYQAPDLSIEDAWFVDFSVGYVGIDRKSDAYHVRAVRTGP